MRKRTLHKKIEMKKNKTYMVICDKIVASHCLREGCSCSDVVVNLMGGLRVWTIVEFECGERVKVNCHCLKRV